MRKYMNPDSDGGGVIAPPDPTNDLTYLDRDHTEDVNGVPTTMKVRDWLGRGRKAEGADKRFQEAAALRKEAEGLRGLADRAKLLDDLNSDDVRARSNAFSKLAQSMGHDDSMARTLWNAVHGITDDETETQPGGTNVTKTQSQSQPQTPAELQELLTWWKTMKQQGVDPVNDIINGARAANVLGEDKARQAIGIALDRSPELSRIVKRDTAKRTQLVDHLYGRIEGRVGPDNFGKLLSAELDSLKGLHTMFADGAAGSGPMNPLGIGSGPGGQPGTGLSPLVPPTIKQSDLGKTGAIGKLIGQKVLWDKAKAEESEM